MSSLARLLLVGLFILAEGVQADPSYWQDSPQSDLESAKLARTAPLPADYRILTVDLDQLTETLDSNARRGGTPVTIDLPHPEGGFSAFEMYPSGVMSPGLAAKFPEIRAYKGYSVEGVQASVQLEITPKGVTAQVLSPGNRWMLDPVSAGRPDLVLSYFAKSTASEGRQWQCQHESHDDSPLPDSLKGSLSPEGNPTQSRSIGQSLRTYRLAVAATGEYTKKFGTGTKSDGMSAIVTTINRVKGIYEKEVGVSFSLIGDNDSIVFTDPTADPFTGNDDARVLINESQTVIDDVIGGDNYDIGHTFSTGAGGVAGTGPCTGSKARGITGRSDPQGDAYDVDYVAHEIGHQFSASHTFNGNSSSNCRGNMSVAHAYEPGSGSTILSYAGICSPDNLQPNSDPIFSAESFDEITEYSIDGNGATCGTLATNTNPLTNQANVAPKVSEGSHYTVPSHTPIVLEGYAFDWDGDQLTYFWEQRDLGPAVALGDADNGQSPLFRVWQPVPDNPMRYIPKLSDVVAGTFLANIAGSNGAEVLPTKNRVMDFRFTARDGVGGVSSDDVVINIKRKREGYPAFSLLEPSAGGVLGGTATVRWDVAETASAPVSASQVELYLSTDSGATFSFSPFATVDNNGYARVTFPAGINTAAARLMLKGASNVFYDVSNQDFTLNSSATATPEIPTPDVWSLVAKPNTGARIYFGEGADTGGTANTYSSVCRSRPRFEETSAVNQSVSDTTSVTNSINIDVDGNIADGVFVDVDVSHGRRGDIKLQLTSPGGTTKTIKAYNDGTDDRSVYADNVILDNILLAYPVEEELRGNWTLLVEDKRAARDGTVVSWAIRDANARTVTADGATSPITFADNSLVDGTIYDCNLTAYDDTVTPRRGGAMVVAGSVAGSAASPQNKQVTSTSGSGGSIIPEVASLPTTINTTPQYSLVPDAGFEVGSVGGTCGGVLAGNNFTVAAVTANCTVEANFVRLAPGQPTISRVEAEDGAITLFFAPGSGVTPTSYTASCTAQGGGVTSTSDESSPITVSGLADGVDYRCHVVAKNGDRESPSSALTSVITPGPLPGLPIWLLYEASK